MVEATASARARLPEEEPPRDEPPRAPEHRLLDLQRAAGNQAVARMAAAHRLARAPAPVRLGSATRRTLARGGKHHAELAILILQDMMHGVPNPTAGFAAEYQAQAHEVQLSLLNALKPINYWFRFGCVRRTEDGEYELIRPAPAHAIAGWVPDLFNVSLLGESATLAPRDPRYFPAPPDVVKPYLPPVDTPPPSDAPPSEPVALPLGPQRARGPEELHTAEALDVAAEMISRRLGRQPLLSWWLSPEQQGLAQQIGDHLLFQRVIYERLVGWGARRTVDGEGSEWVHPPPAEAIAWLLGIGPEDRSDLQCWTLREPAPAKPQPAPPALPS